MSFEHTDRIEALLRQGKRREAVRLHKQHVDAELERAKREPINLSDLLAANEAFHLDEIEREGP
jgi:hypothetical protein